MSLTLPKRYPLVCTKISSSLILQTFFSSGKSNLINRDQSLSPSLMNQLLKLPTSTTNNIWTPTKNRLKCPFNVCPLAFAPCSQSLFQAQNVTSFLESIWEMWVRLFFPKNYSFKDMISPLMPNLEFLPYFRMMTIRTQPVKATPAMPTTTYTWKDNNKIVVWSKESLSAVPSLAWS